MIDQKYWNNYYKKTVNALHPSPFAMHCIDKKRADLGQIIDVGCGNGRDSFYFLECGLNVIGLDSSATVIENNNSRLSDLEKNYIKFNNEDFCKFDYSNIKNSFSVYSRFTLHAIDHLSEDIFFKNLLGANNLNYFCFEVRTIKDDIYGLGECVGKHAFISSHYRRFIDPEEYYKKLSKFFIMEEFDERKGFSPTKEDNPTLLRGICKRRY